jgi:L-lactate dehydrogenase complex protein LldG
VSGILETVKNKDMTSRDIILNRIKANKPAATERPEKLEHAIQYPNPTETFKTMLSSIEGKTFEVSSWEEIIRILSEEYPSFTNRASDIPQLSSWVDFSLAEQDPHTLEHVNIAVVEGKVAVAENAAIWVTEENLSHRVLPFITQYLAIVVPANAMVHNMHEAMEEISTGDYGWGAFISGPSKTADIEQSLVIGAHGARALCVFLLQ